jgi:hypothetical protein
MNKSAMVGELVKAIADGQADYKALLASHKAKIPGKDGKAGFEYDYADLGDGLSALQNTLNARGVAVLQDAYSVDRGVEVVTTLALGEQWMESRPLFMPVQGNAQAVGSAITYARRYSLFPMVGLAPADDDGEEANRNPPAASKPAAKARAPKVDAPLAPPPAEPVNLPRLGDTPKGKPLADKIHGLMLDAIDATGFEPLRVWRSMLTGAGVDGDWYVERDGHPPKDESALTFKDGPVVKAFIEKRLAEMRAEAAASPPGDVDPKADCARLFGKLCQRSPDAHTDTTWKVDHAHFAGLSAWPDRPTKQQYQAAADGMRHALAEMEAP